MNYTLLSFGLMLIIFGLIFTYVVIGSFMRITANFGDFSKQITSEAISVKRNQIFTDSLPGLVIIAIGVLLIRLSLRR